MSKSISLLLSVFLLSGCGLKVVKPGEDKDKDTKMVDWSGGSPKVVSTFNCKLESSGKKFSANGKTEEDARKEVLAKCQDHSVISFCKAENVKCSAPK